MSIRRSLGKLELEERRYNMEIKKSIERIPAEGSVIGRVRKYKQAVALLFLPSLALFVYKPLL